MISSEASPYLLDANVLFHALYTPGAVAADLLEPLKPSTRRLLLSHGTLWETLAKVHRGKSGLGRPGLKMEAVQVEVRAIRGLGIELVPITEADILAAIALPDLHRDPFDRMVIAQAQRLGATIVSSDRTLAQYGVPVLSL